MGPPDLTFEIFLGGFKKLAGGCNTKLDEFVEHTEKHIATHADKASHGSCLMIVIQMRCSSGFRIAEEHVADCTAMVLLLEDGVVSFIRHVKFAASTEN